MKALVIGKGGREHAIVHALLKSQLIESVYAAPGSQGMGSDVSCLNVALEVDAIAEVCKKNEIDLIIIGPEDPLVAGLASDLRDKGLFVFGPDKSGARLEGSKIASKIFMESHDIPTARFEVVDSVAQTMKEAETFTPPYVLKADGLAAGKGVYICENREELEKAANDLFVRKVLGVAGEKALLEQFQPGFELSFFILTTGKDYIVMPMAQDHKKIYENEKGPNTGGMGTVAPMEIESDLYNQIISKIVEPTQKGISAEGFDYRGVVFIGIMVTEQGPQVLEYNVRFGDPETQVLLPLLDGDWGEVFFKIAKAELPEVKWKDLYTTCVVLAAENYPDTPVKDVVIEGDFKGSESQYFLHAGTKQTIQGQWVTAGGRVLNSIGCGSTLPEAISKAYAQAEKVQWPGRQIRKDIGQKGFKAITS